MKFSMKYIIFLSVALMPAAIQCMQAAKAVASIASAALAGGAAAKKVAPYQGGFKSKTAQPKRK